MSSGRIGASSGAAATAIDEGAPVVGASELAIAADTQLVWDVLTTFELWPSWNDDVRSMSIRGAVTPGSEFRWKAGPGTIISTITRVEPLRLIAWTGKTFGIRATHVYRFESRGNDTFVQTEESYDGILARLFSRPLQRKLDRALADGLRYLKREAERQVTV